jgi:hypothetical protein
MDAEAQALSAHAASVILAGHGERAGQGENRRLRQLAVDVGALAGVDCRIALVNEARLIEDALEAGRDRSLLVIPVLFSDGYFFARRLAPAVLGAGRALAPPLALWPQFPAFLVNAARSRGVGPDGRLLLIAHGSKTSGRSAAVARRLVGQMADGFRGVTCAFLEEEPFAGDVVGAAEFDLLLGLFMGEGLHGGEDFARLAAARPDAAALTVGEAPGLAQFIAEEARERLATIARS